MKYLISFFLCMILSSESICAQSAKSDSMFAIGVDLYNTRQYEKAIPIFAKCDSLENAEMDSTSYRRNYSAMWLASCYYQLGDTVRAKSTSKYYKSVPVEMHLMNELDSLSQEFVNSIGRNDYSEALSTLLLMNEKIEHSIGNDNLLYGETQASLGTIIYYTKNDMPRTIGHFERAIPLLEKYDGMDLYEHVIIHLGHIYSLTDLSKAIDLLERGKQTIEIKLGKDNDDYTQVISYLAKYLGESGYYDKAISYNLENLARIEKLHGKESSDYTSVLRNLGIDYSNKGQYEEGLKYHLEALRIRKKMYGREHQSVVQSLCSIGADYAEMEKYPEALETLTECLNIAEMINDRKAMSDALNQISLIYSGLKNYDEALKIQERTLQIRQQLYGKNSILYAESLGNLAVLYSYKGRIQEAIKTNEESLKIKESTVGRRSQNYLRGLGNQAFFYSMIENYAKSREIYKQCLSLEADVTGKYNPDYATHLYHLADTYHESGDNQEAIKKYKETLEIQDKVLDKTHSEYIRTIMAILLNYIRPIQNDSIKDIEKFSFLLYNSVHDYVRQKFVHLTEKERTLIWEGQFYKFAPLLQTEAILYESAPLSECAYNATLLNKGLLLNTSRETKDIILSSGNTEIVSLYEKLSNNRKLIDEQREKTIESRTLNIDSLEIVTTKLERELLKKSQPFRDLIQNQSVTWQDVKRKLKADELGIEFTSIENDDTIYYHAFILLPEEKFPIYKRLCKMNKPVKSPMNSALLWKPLEEYLEKAKYVYFAPTGDMYNTPIETLPHWSEDCLMSDKWNIYRLSSTRELALIKDRNNVNKASVYGGIKYDTDEQVLANDSKRYGGKREMSMELFDIADSLNLRSGVAYLPATRTEAENIDKTLEQKHITTTLKLDTLATEGAFKDLSGKRTNLLHIATHGFYWTEREASMRRDMDFLMFDDKHPKYVEDKAMTRSGLLFAGANNALMGKKLPEGVNDGILTAKEIAQLDLRGLDLVVLSACQTGLGDIKGDGVFGLQRGFKKAGANSLMMSLWKVDDNATQMLMTEFYKNLTSGKSKHESLKLAQKYVREYEEEVEVRQESRPAITAHAREQARKNTGKEKRYKKVRPYEKPEYWAAFILLDAID